ncbi:MAG TPA: right-handed parallel beta-helix repeat-containing protein [Candidatus Angelobacter sp.]|nr:right-handed parallel beta-helix repeat-containing protein [Candidatus Angelobacter sp.]
MTTSRFHGRILSSIAAFFLATQILTAQNIIHVPVDQPTIQDAINAANNGDTVLVAPGTYIENLNFNGKAITVTSSGGPAVTIVDGNAKAPVAIFNTNEGPNSVLNGFTLQNGLATGALPEGNFGGGIFIFFSSPTITNNLITGNHATCGLGITIEGGSAVIRGNTITGNNLTASSGCGGGIEIMGGSLVDPPATPLIVGNTITNNNLAAGPINGGSGGGIGVDGISSPIIRNNYIAGNTAYYFGGGIYLTSSSTPVVVQNIIVNNSVGAGGSGGGITVESPNAATDVIINNTIVGNTAVDGSSGIFTNVLSGSTISNNIVVAPAGQTAIVCSSFSATSPPSFSHNDAFASGGGPAWSSNCAGFAQSNGNISADPQFADAANGNYHLQAGSAAIDAGDNTDPDLPQQDYDGNPRIVDGNNDCVSTVDLGAYELPGGAANVSFSSGILSFSSQPIGTSSSPQTATLTNTGAGCFQFAGTQITSDFTQTNTCATAGVPGGGSCAYNVTFTPAVTGLRTGTLTVTGSDGLTKSAPAVSLSGTGTDFSVAASPTSGTVKHGQSIQFNIAVAPVAGQFNPSVSLSCAGLPGFVGCAFSPSVVVPGGNGASSVLTISTGARAARGTFNISVIGQSGSLQHSATITVTVK